MINLLFNGFISLLGNLVKIVLYPLNALISSTLPDISSAITTVTTLFSNIFSCMSWALGLLPSSVITTLLLILTLEISRHTIFISTHALIKLWNLFQKLKFW